VFNEETLALLPLQDFLSGCFVSVK